MVRLLSPILYLICVDVELEPECCDGSDERPGVCKNICKEVGEAYRQKRDAERKIQKTVRHTFAPYHATTVNPDIQSRAPKSAHPISHSHTRRRND